ncbi:uncharacterized protein N7459_002855 [Penicillium hispanicum]|uniref:uncharacterized protein n=1 Tax=Penicillium hispanicum TaxID=1080232 RepID=UPI0025410DA0|nr:uncharacterized protein N7459_002855 [Penicillium hispanicum]KAJ5587090.1 hypothetical protein N7459_002855 [Penicillium hispanicum]
MGRSLTGTVIITGGNGLLKSEIAVAIAKAQLFVHLLLTARNVKGEDVRNLTARIRIIGPRSIEILSLDLTDLSSVIHFTQVTVDRVRSRDIPPVISLIHSAAIASYAVDELTLDGYDPVYQTNCVAPQRRDSRRPGTVLSAREGNIRFGSSKLLASVALYALRRSLSRTGNISLDIFTMDPGGMAGESHLRTGAPWSVRVAHQTRTGLRPFLRMVSRSSVNKACVPAKAIAQVAFQRNVVGTSKGTERYFILDREYEAASVLPALRDESQMAMWLVQMMRRVEGSWHKTSRSPSIGPLDAASPATMNRHSAFPKGNSPYPRPSSAFAISPNRFQPRSQPALRRRRQLFQRLLLLGGVSLLLVIFFFPSWRAVILPTLSFGLVHPSEDLQLQTVRYYDLSEVQGTEKGWERGERVLMLTPLRDASSHLPMFFSHLRNLTYPHSLIDLAFLVSDSRDETLEMLSHMLQEMQNDPDPKMSFGEISVIQKDFGQKVQQDVESRHGFEAQANRRKLMAQARNWLLSATLRPTHSWVYWRDADVETAPFTIIEDLMRHNKDVIVPNVWRPLPDWLGGEQPYDLNSWQESETALALADTLDEDAVIVEGYAEYATWRPHLAYLRDPYGDPDMEMELDGIGGVSILAKARVFRAGVHFPAFSFEKHAETEGFGKMAKRMKFSVIGLPHYTIWHLYEPSVDDLRHMEEMELERLAHEQEEKERELTQQNGASDSKSPNAANGEYVKGSAEGPAAQPVKDAAKGSSNK